jgi:hypothetical protein
VVALTAPQPGTWLRAVPWLGLALLAAAVGMSRCRINTRDLNFGVMFSAGQMLTGAAVLCFVAHQVLGALWGLVARRDDGRCGVRTTLAESAVASLHGTAAWLPVVMIPWFLGDVSAALTGRILVVGFCLGFTARLFAALVRARMASRMPRVLCLPADLLAGLALGTALAAGVLAGLVRPSLLNPLVPVGPLLIPVWPLLWCFGMGRWWAPVLLTFGSLPACVLAHLLVQAGCVLLLAVYKRGCQPARPRLAGAPPAAAAPGAMLWIGLVVLLSPRPASASPTVRTGGGPMCLSGEVRFEAVAAPGTPSVLALPLGSAAVLLHAESEVEGRLVYRWELIEPYSGDTAVETSRRIHLPAHRVVVEAMDQPEACQAFRAGMPPLSASLTEPSRLRLLGVALDLTPTPGPPRRVVLGRLPRMLVPVGLDELRALLHLSSPPSVLLKLSDLAKLSEADAGLLVDALCTADTEFPLRVVVVDDVAGPPPPLSASARLLLPRRLADAKLETGADYLRAISFSWVAARAPWAAMPEPRPPFTVRGSAEDDDGPLCPVPFRVSPIGQGTCAYLAFDPGAPFPSDSGAAAGLAEALLGRHEYFGGCPRPRGHADAFAWPSLATVVADHATLPWLGGLPWNPATLRGGRWAPLALAGAVLLAAGLAPLLLARRPATACFAAALAATLSLAAGRWLGSMREPRLEEVSLTRLVPALARSVTERLRAVFSPWANRVAPGGWPNAAASVYRREVRPPLGVHTASAGFASGLALAAGTVESVQVTDVAPWRGSVTGSLAIAADGSVEGTLSNGTGQELTSAVVFLPAGAPYDNRNPPAMVVPGLRAGAALRLPPGSPVPRELVAAHLAGTALAEFWPGLRNVYHSRYALFLGSVADPGATAGRKQGRTGRPRQVHLVTARIEVDRPVIAEARPASVLEEALAGWEAPPEPGSTVDDQARREYTDYSYLALPYGSYSGSPPRPAPTDLRWADLPAEADLCLKIRHAWVTGPPPAESANPADPPLGRLEISVLDVLDGTWKVVTEEALRAMPKTAAPAGAAMISGAPGPYAVAELGGRRRVIVGDQQYHEAKSEVSPLGPQDGLRQDLDACGTVVRLPEARRYVHRPGGMVFLRATGTRGPLTAWLVSVGARVVGGDADRLPPPPAPGPNPW